MRRELPGKIDILVIGAGTGGATAARTAAAAGHTVVLVERVTARDVGRKVCGNALDDVGLESMARHGVAPHEMEIATRLTGGELVLNDGANTVEVRQPGVVLNRYLFGQRLLAEAIEAGATLLDECTCLGWQDRDEARVRLAWRDGEETDVAGRVVIDASGYASTLTRHGGPFGRSERLSRADVGIGYREIFPLTDDIDRADRATIVLAPEDARTGYGWIFPMGERLVNAGLGATLYRIGPNVKDVFHRFIAARTRVSPGPPIAAGTGLVPLRRPIPNFVGDRFMAVGDAACHADPLHGGGIASSVVAGALAGEQAIVSLAARDVGVRGLWEYNVRFMRETGARHAAHEALRNVVYSLPDKDLSVLISRFARAGHMTAPIRGRRSRPRLSHTGAILGTCVRRPRLARFLLGASRLVDATFRLYEDYPEAPTRLESWIGHTEYLKQSLQRSIAGGAR